VYINPPCGALLGPFISRGAAIATKGHVVGCLVPVRSMINDATRSAASACIAAVTWLYVSSVIPMLAWANTSPLPA